MDSTSKLKEGNSKPPHVDREQLHSKTDEATEAIAKLVQETVEDMPLQEYFRHDFKYRDKPTIEFKEHLLSLLKPKYTDIEEVKALYNLLSGYLNVDTPSVEWNQELECSGLYHYRDRKILLKQPATLGIVLHEYYHYLNHLNPSCLDRVTYLLILGLLSLPEDQPLEDSVQQAFRYVHQLLKEGAEEAKKQLLLRKIQQQIDSSFSFKTNTST